MNKRVIAVFRKKTPSRQNGKDVCVWHRDVGFLVDPATFENGEALWATYEGQGEKLRLLMRFCPALGKIVFPEAFVRARKEARPWEAIKREVKELFGGAKPEGMSWKRAKALVKEAKALREAPKKALAPKNRDAKEDRESWHRLMSHKMGAPAFLHA